MPNQVRATGSMNTDVRRGAGGRRHGGAAGNARRAARFGRGFGRRVAMTALGLVAPLGIVGCFADEGPAFDPRDFHQVEHARAASTTRPALSTMPTDITPTPRVQRGSGKLPENLPSTGPSVRGDEAVRMPLREVIQRAVASSSEVRVAGYDPAINAQRVIEQRGRFDPRFFTNLRYDRTDNQTAGSAIPDPLNPFASILIDAERADVYTAEVGLRQLLPGGGEARLSYQIQQSDFDPRRFRENPYWENQLRLELTQPLLRDFGGDINAARITIAINDERISVLDFRRVLEEQLTEIERSYWQLVQSQREVTIREGLLQRTIETYSTLYSRWISGLDASLIAVRQAEASVKSSQALLIEGKRRVREVSLDLKRRMNDPDFPVSGKEVILPADEPLLQPVNFDTAQQVESAMLNRLELGQQQLRVDSADVALRVARNAMLPQLNLVTSGSFNGIGGESSDAFSSQSDFNHFSASVGLQFEFPIGNREARSVYRRAQLQRLQAIEQYRNLVGIVTQDVATALNDVQGSWEQALMRRESAEAYRRQIALIEEQEDPEKGGAKLTPEFVNVKLQAFENLAQAEQQEAAAIANYNISIQRLERSKGTLLRYNNVILQEDKTGRDAMGARAK